MSKRLQKATKLLADGMRAGRAHRRLSQVQLAKRLGVSELTVSRYENGHQWPDPKRLEDIAHALDMTIAGLFKQR